MGTVRKPESENIEDEDAGNDEQELERLITLSTTMSHNRTRTGGTTESETSTNSLPEETQNYHWRTHSEENIEDSPPPFTCPHSYDQWTCELCHLEDRSEEDDNYGVGVR